MLAILRKRMVFDACCWSFAYYHEDMVGIKEHLASSVGRAFLKQHLLYFKGELG